MGRECMDCGKNNATRWVDLGGGKFQCEVCQYRQEEAKQLDEGYDAALRGIEDGTLQPTHKDSARCIYGCTTSPNWLILAKPPRQWHSHYASRSRKIQR